MGALNTKGYRFQWECDGKKTNESGCKGGRRQPKTQNKGWSPSSVRGKQGGERGEDESHSSYLGLGSYE